MFPNLSKHLATLEALNLDPEEYLITGGAVLAVHEMRDCDDLDIVCSDKLAEELKARFPEVSVQTLSLGQQAMLIQGIEFMFNFKEEGRPWTTDQQIKEADIIGGKRYQTLEKSKFFKHQMSRPKDLQDIRLIEMYENGRA